MAMVPFKIIAVVFLQPSQRELKGMYFNTRHNAHNRCTDLLLAAVSNKMAAVW